jgi:hypothetical protein
MVPYVGSYYSMNWVKKNVLHLTEDEIKTMDQETVDEQEKMAQINLMQQAQAAALGGAPPSGINTGSAPTSAPPQ